MHQSTSYRQPTPSSTGQLASDTTCAQPSTATRSARAASTSSNSDAASAASAYHSNASTYGSTESSSNRKRKLDETVEMLNGVDLVPRATTPAIQSLRADPFEHAPRPKRAGRGRSKQSAFSALPGNKRLNGSQPFGQATVVQDGYSGEEYTSKRLRTQAAGAFADHACAPRTPTYVASPENIAAQQNTSNQDCRKRRAASLPLQFEGLLSRARLSDSTTENEDSKIRGMANGTRPSQVTHSQLDGVPHITVSKVYSGMHVQEMPPLVPLIAIAQERILPPITHQQLVTIHQIHLPRPSASNTSALHTCLRRSSALPGVTPPRPSLQHTRSNSQAHGVPSIPSLRPPVTKDTLKELDLAQILKCRQLRHDVVFDADLVFRPSFDGDRGDRKREAAERYWIALTRELKTGCRCTAFSFAPSATAIHLGQQADILPCVCHSSTDLVSRLPSRIGRLAIELRDTLIAILPVTQGAVSEMAATHRAIREHIDPELIAQEVAHGILDLASIARFLVPILKAHCAPMRDELVDYMVKAIEKGQEERNADTIVVGLRCCFSVLEVMKLDIANHQIRVVRPHLLDTAAEYERSAFISAFEGKQAGDALAKTKEWIQAAAIRQRADNGQSASVHLKQTVTDGILELICKPKLVSKDGQTSKSIRPSSRKTKMLRLPSPTEVPEVLELDVSRLQAMHIELFDLTIVSLLLLLFRQLCSTAKRLPTTAELAVIKQEILVLKRDLGARIDCSGLKILSNSVWKEGMKDVVLQIARKAGSTGRLAGYLPSAPTIDMLYSWLENNLVAEAPLFALVSSRIRKTVFDLVQVKLAEPKAPKADSAGSLEESLRSNGLIDLSAELQGLSDRLTKLVSFNLATYRPIYDATLKA